MKDRITGYWSTVKELAALYFTGSIEIELKTVRSISSICTLLSIANLVISVWVYQSIILTLLSVVALFLLNILRGTIVVVERQEIKDLTLPTYVNKSRRVK